MASHDHNKQQQQKSLSTPSTPSTPTRSRPQNEHESSGSPQRPSYSPVTPTLSQTSLAAQDDARAESPPSQWMDEPEPLPVSLDDNPDAMALRATLSILQLQRNQALQDMRELNKMKQAALEDPERFVRDLQEGKLNQSPRKGVEVDDVAPGADDNNAKDASKFGQFPSAQNVVRCPPVEWAKYHIVGEPLDRIHEQQQQYPGLTEEMSNGSHRPRPHAIAAPFSPFVDKLEGARATPKSRNVETKPV
ncbi:uncharacterized protein Z518_06153 [Rhinocladiella mackenziei CBS 650.93]|uniref:Rhinocladiella mackenziei CBS 650.93 unplaced genomic scaffold supercont1.4, whole genome shotgun sequence n=1 Tax=Rhinocladiella mackenziei CBS 650.93 TaxID=1442369 RepID=A0A0D2IQ21_9EURO|nr:uncharacterized protein Z518_06153 [Rhinocladiella mackenziei CBS 650.93]KIX05281.1 hypothetical protein Z518_06153 [Rhinocladiella mackenziei CBS 650.93]